jgi:acetyl-CoA carboxylase biotin carboxyl carrier protein
MDIQEIEKIVDLVKNADISELTITGADINNPSRITIHKNLLKKNFSGKTKKSDDINKKAERNTSSPASYTKETFISAPMVGIFHWVDDFKNTGVNVSVGQVVGQIESMKLMNDVVSEHDGIITEIFAEDEIPVEYGQHLFRVENKK